MESGQYDYTYYIGYPQMDPFNNLEFPGESNGSDFHSPITISEKIMVSGLSAIFTVYPIFVWDFWSW